MTKGENVTIDFFGKKLEILLKEDIPFGHKFAIDDIKEGEEVFKYGEAIGESTNTELKGIKLAREMATELSLIQKEEIDLSELSISVECGGSDTTSGLASNPAVGYVADKVVDAGTIMDGTETIPEVGERIFKEVLEVINGKYTKAELLNHREFGI